MPRLRRWVRTGLNVCDLPIHQREDAHARLDRLFNRSHRIAMRD